LTVNTDLNHNN